MSLELQVKQQLARLEGAILAVNPTATFTIIQDDLDQDTFNILYKHDEITQDIFEELTNFRFVVFYVSKHPEGLQFRVKAVNGETICI